jgi:adenylate kinase family enzyme/inosine/xanthosine triphosphate pyrophosphatase family protein
VKKLYFITSNRVKLMHARHIALAYHTEIYSKRNYGIAYREPRSFDRAKLLQKSYEDAHRRWLNTGGNPHAFFFIEDTSLVIRALSKRREFPGVDVKYWMQKTNFQSLDAKLRKHGNDRRVTVRSDVLLHLPDDFRQKNKIAEQFLHFIGETDGTITNEEVRIETNLLYPWLDNRSFNKWFVPTNCDRPISALPIEVADRYDIRKNSIGAMLKFLSEKEIFEKQDESTNFPFSKYLPHLFPPLSIVTGMPCAGKTTLGMHLSECCGYYHIEASDFMKRAFYERHGLNSQLSIESFAEEALLKTPDIVVTPVIEEIRRCKADLIVITGFRSPKEIEIFKSKYRGPAEVACWYIEASQDIRFRRSVSRARHDAAPSVETFQTRDDLQLKMGLKAIRKLLRDSTIVNEGTIQGYVRTVTDKFDCKPIKFVWPKNMELHERPTSLEDAILISLARQSQVKTGGLTTTQIAHHLNKVFEKSSIETSKNNVSRYFNFRPHPFYKVTNEGGVLKYSLSATGMSRALRLIDSLKRQHRTSAWQLSDSPQQS